MTHDCIGVHGREEWGCLCGYWHEMPCPRHSVKGQAGMGPRTNRRLDQIEEEAE